MRLGFSEEAAAFMDWLEARCTQTPPRAGLRILYTLDGGPVPAEESLEHLRGYRDSRPVRIGNGAADQLQLDIYGELMDSVYLYDRYAEPISYELWVALCRQLDWLEGHWEKADHGVWEVRGPMQRFTYSSVMTWVAFQRGARIAAERGLPAPLDRWRASADRAYLHVQEESWSPERKAYVQFPGSRTLDAGALVLPLVKFSGPRDPRFLATLDRIEQELVTDSLVHRYQNDGSDGFTEAEGTFNLCSFWYVEALTRAGRLDQARHTFEKMLTYANHLGLYAEEIGPVGRGPRELPAGLHASRPDQRRRQPRPGPGHRARPVTTGSSAPLDWGAVEVRSGRRSRPPRAGRAARRPDGHRKVGRCGRGAVALCALTPDPTGRRRFRQAARLLTDAEPEDVPGFVLMIATDDHLAVLAHGAVTVSVTGGRT